VADVLKLLCHAWYQKQSTNAERNARYLENVVNTRAFINNAQPPKRLNAMLIKFMSKRRATCILALYGSLFFTSVSHSQGSMASSSTAAPDQVAITDVINTYSKAVATRDEALFMSTMLDDQVPLFSANDDPSQKTSLKSADMRELSGLRNIFFHGKEQFQVTFDHITVQQDRSLAQVFAHFVTSVGPKAKPILDGWKSIQLLKVGSQWKIVSELYTIENFPSKSSSAAKATASR
jgi:ketosteroid isomerase-like protein